MLERWIVDPPALVPATAMPSVGVAEHDARNMAAYLLSLR
jgi:cytochrome c2